MKNKIIYGFFVFSTLLLFALSLPVLGQTKQLLKRTTYKTETVEFGVGGTISIIGAPTGAITIEGWQKNEVEISAEIEVQAENEGDLALLAAVNSFTFDVTMGRISIISVGTHDKSYLKREGKKLAKKLLGMPVKIDYKIKVPVFSDLEIDGGHGNFDLSNVEGAMRINFLDTNAGLKLSGGAIAATFGSGNVAIEITNRSWRGQGVNIQLGKGALYVALPPNLNAELDAAILRTGRIANEFVGLKPRDRTKFTEKLIAGRAGNGGAKLAFTVGDGELELTTPPR
jgi:hypothetical protein